MGRHRRCYQCGTDIHLLDEGTGPETCTSCGCRNPVLTKDDRLIQPLGDDRFNTLDGNRVLVREDIKGQKQAIESARFGPPGRRVFWLNDDDTVEPL